LFALRGEDTESHFQYYHKCSHATLLSNGELLARWPGRALVAFHTNSEGLGYPLYPTLQEGAVNVITPLEAELNAKVVLKNESTELPDIPRFGYVSIALSSWSTKTSQNIEKRKEENINRRSIDGNCALCAALQ
jgi:hypothetical protein